MHCICNAYLIYLSGVIKMAEFCLDCWNRIMGINDSSDKYIISKDLDLCEGCGEYKHVIVRIKDRFYLLKRLNIRLYPLMRTFRNFR